MVTLMYVRLGIQMLIQHYVFVVLVYQLNLWRPPSDLQSLLKEGCRYKVYNLTASEGKKPVGSTSVQLTGTKKTQFQDLQVGVRNKEHAQCTHSTEHIVFKKMIK